MGAWWVAGWDGTGDRIPGAAGTSTVAAGIALLIATAIPTAYFMTIRRGTELAALRGAE